jgi:hypothetical protein
VVAGTVAVKVAAFGRPFIFVADPSGENCPPSFGASANRAADPHVDRREDENQRLSHPIRKNLRTERNGISSEEKPWRRKGQLTKSSTGVWKRIKSRAFKSAKAPEPDPF